MTGQETNLQLKRLVAELEQERGDAAGREKLQRAMVLYANSTLEPFPFPGQGELHHIPELGELSALPVEMLGERYWSKGVRTYLFAPDYILASMCQKILESRKDCSSRLFSQYLPQGEGQADALVVNVDALLENRLDVDRAAVGILVLPERMTSPQLRGFSRAGFPRWEALSGELADIGELSGTARKNDLDFLSYQTALLQTQESAFARQEIFMRIMAVLNDAGKGDEERAG